MSSERSDPDPISALGRHSPRLRPFRELRKAADRRRKGAFVLEGPHLFEQLLAALDAGDPIPYRPRFFILNETYRKRFDELNLGEVCRRHKLRGGLVGDRTIEQLSDTASPQGILAEIGLGEDAHDVTSDLVRSVRRRRTLRAVLAEGVADPGNLGSLVRAAAGLGVQHFLAHGGADPFGPKVLRASAGAFLTLPYGEVRDPAEFLKAMSAAGVTIIATVPRDGRAPETVRPPQKYVLLLGAEARGLPGSWIRNADVRVTIPLRRGVESLNVAVAGSIVMYQLATGGRRARR